MKKEAIAQLDFTTAEHLSMPTKLRCPFDIEFLHFSPDIKLFFSISALMPPQSAYLPDPP